MQPSSFFCLFLSASLPLGGHFSLYISFSLILTVHLLIIQVATRVPIHPPPSSTCCELRRTRWYCLGVISSLMQPDCQLRAFNAEVTASPRIAPPPRPHSCPTVLVLLFGTIGRAVFEGVLLSLSVTLVGRGKDDPRRCLLATWAFLTHPRMFLLFRCGPWA